jgi:hypothetical protein
VDWIHLAQDRDQRWVLVNMVIPFKEHGNEPFSSIKRRGISCLLASQGLGSMDLAS